MKTTTSNMTLRGAWGALALAIASVLTLIANQAAHAQTFQVLYNFSGGADGAYPYAGLTTDRAGNLYGTTAAGGSKNCNGGGTCGVVFRLQNRGSGWLFNPLYSFASDGDGFSPQSRVIFGPDGALYSTTATGGTGDVGTVFKLRPLPTACKTALCPWMKTTLYNFTGAPDGNLPLSADVSFDTAGNLYGTTAEGGSGHACPAGCGAVYELTPSGGGWTENVIYSFQGGSDGKYPSAGLALDNAGNLYSTTSGGGKYGYGTVFELSYSAGGGWTEKVLYSFQNGSDGNTPQTGLVFDRYGNLYGGTDSGGTGGGGTLFELSPGSGGNWTFTTIYSFVGGDYYGPPPGSVFAFDGSGNLYGTSAGGAYTWGNVFKLTPSAGGWTYQDLYDFTCGDDGCFPSGVIVDAQGSLYGTAGGGLTGFGNVWEITP